MKTLVTKTIKTNKKGMKPLEVNKKKEQRALKVASVTQDTIADTIAFVIKGQLTPIKPTPLPDAKSQKNVIKRLQKGKCTPLKKPKVQDAKPVNLSSTTLIKPCKEKRIAAEQAKTCSSTKSAESQLKKKLTKTRKKEDLNSSIQKIIQKYAKKFNIKRSKNGTQPKQPDKKSKPPISGPLSESQKSIDLDITTCKRYDKKREENESNVSLKIKEEKPEEEVPIAVKTEPDEVVANRMVPEQLSVDSEVKVEPIEIPKEAPKKKVTEKIDKETNQSILNNQAVKAKKLRLLKKKTLINKEAKQKMEDKRRAKLIQFWNSPKRHRVASLNAIAKVHCLYENESKAAFEKIAENSIIKDESSAIISASKNVPQHISSDSSSESDSEEQAPKRTLRNVPGLRAVGKHWDMFDCLSSDNDDIDRVMYRAPKRTVRVKKEIPNKRQDKSKKDPFEDKEKKKRKASQEVVMDLKDMVVKKRMASLNASAILAASYSSDKKSKTSRATESSSYDSDSSAEEYFAAVQQIDLTKDPKEEAKQEEDKSLIEVHTTPNKKVAVILNQDTDVTITGVYVNSTTRSTHHEGYCSIAGMQYRISATSHTQTAATTVATETLLQSASSSDNAHSDAQSCSSKSYTPLDALSNMQPPPGPGIHNTLPAHAGMPCQVGSPQLRQHPSSSAFTSPNQVPPGHPGIPPGQPPPSEPHGGYVRGYYQPAGPLISVPLGHGQPPLQQPPLPKSVPLSDASPTSLSSSTHQTQGPPAPSSANGDSSDNEVIITSVTAGRKDPHPPISHPISNPYRYPQFSQYPSYACPPQYHYQTPPPPQTPPYPHHEMCYPTGPPTGYLRHTKYSPSPTGPLHRYPYYSGNELYSSSSVPPSQPSQQVVTAAPMQGAGTYPATTIPPPPPAIMETYPPPPAPPTLVDPYQASPHYYQSAYGLPSTCYSHSPSRGIQYINATYQHCPCPLNTCPKNGHTGPLTGESKRSNISKDSKPLPPVALALPLEPVSATGPPSPARGSAGMPSGGMPPPPSPAGASYQQSAAPKQECRSVETSDQCKVEKRKARVGKANVRNNIMHNTMLLMCNPAQNYVKREIESPKEKEVSQKEVEEEIKEVTEVVPTVEVNEKESVTVESLSKTDEAEVSVKINEKEVIPQEEPLPPCVATVAENVKVKNMKRKQSQSKEPEIAPPVKKKRVSSYKDFIRKQTSCFKINNGKKKLASKVSRTRLPKGKLSTSPKNKLNKTKEQTNNRRMKGGKLNLKKTSKGQKQTTDKLLDDLIAKNRVESDYAIKRGKQVKAESDKHLRAEKTGKRRKSTTKCKLEGEPDLKISRKTGGVPKWSNGWKWEGQPYEAKVFINSDETTLVRTCYPSMRHKEGDLIRPGDCVLLKAGPRKNDLPYVAKIAALWENSEDGEMMMSLLWYYRPEHTEQGRMLTDQPDEVFASRHKDSNSVACIDDKCYVLTFNEYCRYKKHFRRIEEGVEEKHRLVPLPDPYPRIHKQPPSGNLSPDMVFFCRKVYDFRQKRIIKNPT